MKLLLFIGLSIIVFFLGGVTLYKSNFSKEGSFPTEKVDQSVSSDGDVKKQELIKSLFVPYWTLDQFSVEDEYDQYYYFGLNVTNGQLEKNDSGFNNIDNFIGKTPEKSQRFLTVIITDGSTALLLDDVKQESLIQESVTIASDHGFDGILLDFETPALDFGETKNLINKFNKKFSDSSHSENLLFYTAIFGDVYYRARPYDLKKLGSITDGLIIMAYDFHKSRGNPGPTFPFDSQNTYPYSLKKLISDLLTDVDKDKIVIALGMFGYDWEIDQEGNAISNGIPITENQFRTRFIDSCNYDNCLSQSDNEEFGYSARYIEENITHQVWSESESSREKKIDYIKEKNLKGVSYWANSFF